MPRARSKFTDAGRFNVGSDDGIIVYSFTESEKQKVQVTLNDTQFSDISDFKITAKLREGANDLADAGDIPTSVDSDASVVNLDVLLQADSSIGTNAFQLWFDGPTITASFDEQPTVGSPSYAFLSVNIEEDSSQTSTPQKWEIIRGRVEILKSIGA